jgi:hypothetical protein
MTNTLPDSPLGDADREPLSIAEEIAAPYVVTRPKAKSAPTGPTINYDALFADLDRVQRIWDTHLEMDDEDVLTLL